MPDETLKSNRQAITDYPLPETGRGPLRDRSQESTARRSLWPFYHEVETYEYTDPTRARELFDQVLAEGLDNYAASPDLWHNAAMVAGRVRHREAQLAFVEAGLRDWPDNVDLLCDVLQYRHTSHYDPGKAREIWLKLSEMPREVTGPYWRFWVYGAIYHARELYDPNTALKLLDEGLKWVTRDTLMDILRSYRRVLVDSTPSEQFENPEQVIPYQRRALRMLEERYRLGIELGVENGYVLATEIARLYQEQAYIETTNSPATAAVSLSDDSAEERDRNRSTGYLNQALEFLDFAEKLYTGNPNHPIWEIYEARIRILMAQRRYGDALKLLRSLPQARQREPSLATMLRLASLMTGEKVEEEEKVGFSDVLSTLLENDGELLFRIASQNPAVSLVLMHIVQRLGGSRDQI